MSNIGCKLYQDLAIPQIEKKLKEGLLGCQTNGDRSVFLYLTETLDVLSECHKGCWFYGCWFYVLCFSESNRLFTIRVNVAIQSLRVLGVTIDDGYRLMGPLHQWKELWVLFHMNGDWLAREQKMFGRCCVVICEKPKKLPKVPLNSPAP